MNIKVGNRGDITKRPDYKNKVIAWPNNRTNFSKKPVSLNRIIGALDQGDIKVSNKADVKASDKANTGGSNNVGVTIEPHSEDRVIGKVESEVDTKDSYKLHLFIPEDNNAENLLSCNLADVLANLFGDLLSISVNFHFSLVFPISSSYPATSDNINGYKVLDSTFFNSPATCNSGNVLVFYHWLFAYLIIGSFINVVSTNFSYLFSDSI